MTTTNGNTSKTQENLHSAFAGESMANRKYLYFASVARELGNEEVAKLFEKTAEEETGHAFAHLRLVHPPGTLTVEKLLELAAEGELYETNEMYPTFQQEAVTEHEQAAAAEFAEQAEESREHAERFLKMLKRASKQFGALGAVEKAHAQRYLDALEAVRQG
ncbi:rubrerythrin family protein [Gloeobacter violaceus]|uniref:Rubrerythrin-like protein n=1 Tax=Gloeobacter violaceus (strain ATCC 29082 / PCC 7421) TaxID=251221 RepID=Q7NEZ3_GLOVI|nr:rubrerythrin family protein [Gloeobacter violaceus]BAC91675.1 rubrerythrin-like protein [Gloeobacter violaceus PCC 7421]